MKKSIYAISILLLLLTVISCSNSASGEEEEHHPDGFRLILNSQTIVEQLPEQDLTGAIELVEGEETDLITAIFLDHDGHELQPEEDGYNLRYEFTKEGVVEFEQHTEDGKWSFHLHAVSEGDTNLRLRLYHGDHSDFTSNEIPVHINAAEE